MDESDLAPYVPTSCREDGRPAPHIDVNREFKLFEVKVPLYFLARWGFRLAETDVIGYFFRYKVIIRS